jgi:hypothetical protein
MTINLYALYIWKALLLAMTGNAFCRKLIFQASFEFLFFFGLLTRLDLIPDRIDLKQ